MRTVVETSTYLRAAEALHSEAERTEIVSTIARDPEAGDIMPGTGGFRKLRFARAGIGKRGGSRVVYLYGSEDLPISLSPFTAKQTRAISLRPNATRSQSWPKASSTITEENEHEQIV